MICSLFPLILLYFVTLFSYIDIYCMVCLWRMCNLSYIIQAENTRGKQQ